MRRRIASLIVLAALAMCGCGSSGRGTPPTAAAGSIAFPIRVPRATRLVYAEPVGAPAAAAPAEASALQELAVTDDRRAYVACQAAGPMRFVSALSVAAARRWAALLTPLARIRSDPPDPRSRALVFGDGRRIVTIDVARHVHRAPCTGVECMAMVRADATFRALTPAMRAFGSFIAAHCAAGG